jgi:flagellar assembly protein FliH
LSNVIKAYSVRYDEGTRKTIDTHLKNIAVEINMDQGKTKNADANPQDGFVEGLKAVVVETLEADIKKINDSKITEDAKKEADSIIEQAKKEALKIKDEAFSNAQKKGYDEGVLRAKKEAQKLEAEYAQRMQKLDEERENLSKSLEPQIAGLIAGLVEKITGVVIEDKDEVILYLVEKAVRSLDKCSEFNIKVSSEDYEYVSIRKELLQHAIGREVTIYITEDASLQKNQCLIETETKVINCSLDIQLSNLITDIKLIGGI